MTKWTYILLILCGCLLFACGEKSQGDDSDTDTEADSEQAPDSETEASSDEGTDSSAGEDTATDTTPAHISLLPETPPRNFLFILLDDLRYDPPCGDISPTPNLDRLSTQGVTFSHAYTNIAVCAGSRASLFTGARPGHTGILDLVETMPEQCGSFKTMAQLFKENGFATRAYGKVYHHGVSDDLWGYDEITNPGDTTTMPGNTATEKSTALDDYHSDGQIALMGMEALEELKDEPFFMTLGFKRPHLPFTAPAHYWDEFEGNVSLPPFRTRPINTTEGGVHGSGELRKYDDIASGTTYGALYVDSGNPAESDAKEVELITGYCAATAYADTSMGRVLQKLDELGLSDDTLVVVTTDHGYLMGEYNFWTKHSTYEYATHVPLLFRVPGTKGGRMASGLVELVDLYPTVATIMDVELPENQLDGESLIPLLEDPTQSVKDAAFSRWSWGKYEVGKIAYSIRTERYRYTAYVTFTDENIGRHAPANGTVVERELFDHDADPGETNNISGETDQADLITDLEDRLFDHYNNNIREDLY